MFDDFNNGLIKGIHKSRYIASWLSAGGGKYGLYKFGSWLRELEIDGEKLTLDEIWELYYYAHTGKLELESSARDFIKNLD